ncbi:MAG: hypothetical protein ACK4E3_02510 [Brevundimonas sp.]|jgi:hypothetical protein|uniref:hypothetical protein n=1 Tax=Brevundimonas sp. TaxID=1871086 RepID=UPI003919AA1C
MSLIEKYLRAVAAQLPPEVREDVVAELRDEIMSRVEAREEGLGRPLTPDEVEEELRLLGHPLLVAARFGGGPMHVVGPELYPFWAFAVKIALLVMIAITGIGAVARVVLGDASAGQVIGQAFSGMFWSAMGIVGLATVAGFIIERQKTRPAFLSRWRVRDLEMFEMSRMTGWMVGLGRETTAETDVGASAEAQSSRAASRQSSPVPGALGSAVAWGVFLLWWSGLIGLGIRPEDLGGRVAADDGRYASLLAELVAIAYWPVLLYALARSAFHLIRVVTGAPGRLTAAGDAVFGAVTMGFIGWFWLYSPFAPLIRVDTVEAFLARLSTMFGNGGADIASMIMAGTVFAFIAEVLNVLGALRSLVTGQAR